MRILLDAYNLALPEGTGIATYARNLSHAIDELGHQPEVLYQFTPLGEDDKLLDEISFFDPGDQRRLRRGRWILQVMGSRPVQAGVTIASNAVGVRLKARPVQIGSFVITRGIRSRLPSFDKIWTAPQIFEKASDYFSLTGRFLPLELSPKPDLAHWTLPYPIFVPGIPNIYTIHDVVPLRLPYTTIDNRKRYVRLIRETIARADHLVAISETTKNDILELAPEAAPKITMTFQGVRPTNLPDNSFANLQRLFGLKKQRYFVFVSAIEPKKNVGRMIQAFLGANTSFPLVMVGRKGWLYEKELAPLKYQEVAKTPRRVIQLEYLDYRLMVSLIRSARALLFPSLYEGFGLPILEAMQLGTPVMTSNFGSMAEIAAQGTAALVDPYDIAEMSRTIERLGKDDDLCLALSKAGLERADAFSWDVYKERLTDLYRKVAR